MKKIKNRIQNQFKDSDKKEILSKGFSFLVFSLSGTLAGYLFTLFVARNFGASVNGLIAISFSIFMMATMLGRLGIDINLVKYYSDKNVIRADTGTFFKMLLKALVFSSLIGVSVYLLRDLIAIKIFGKEQLIPYLKWISFAIPLWVSTLLCASFFRAIRKNKTYAFLNNAGRFLVTLILAVGLYYFISKDELITIQAHFYALVCLGIGSFIAVLFYLKPIRIKSDYNSWKFLRESFPMMLSSAILVVLGWIDTFILGIFESDDVVGIYSVSLKIATLTSFGLQAINSILAPKISAAYKQEDNITFKKLISFNEKVIIEETDFNELMEESDKFTIFGYKLIVKSLLAQKAIENENLISARNIYNQLYVDGMNSNLGRESRSIINSEIIENIIRINIQLDDFEEGKKFINSLEQNQRNYELEGDFYKYFKKFDEANNSYDKALKEETDEGKVNFIRLKKVYSND